MIAMMVVSAKGEEYIQVVGEPGTFAPTFCWCFVSFFSSLYCLDKIPVDELVTPFYARVEGSGYEASHNIAEEIQIS